MTIRFLEFPHPANMADDDVEAQASPALSLPQSKSTVEVHIVNTTTDIVVPAKAFIQPVQKGHEYMNLPTFAFLVKNKRLGKAIMFDLGCRKDWWNHSPASHGSIKNRIPGLNIPKSINEVLREGGEDDSKVDAVVWSHWHWDHTGDISLFPKSADLYVGPGFGKAFMPGFPLREDSPVLEHDFEYVIGTLPYRRIFPMTSDSECNTDSLRGRMVHEVSFDQINKIGQYPSFDLFGDGSFYILDVPGHAVGHIAGLARTTCDTFVFMGGDVCHFGGSFRPTPYKPMPSTIPESVPLDKKRFRMPCPCSIFTSSHRDPPNARTSTFYKVTQEPTGW